MTVHPVDGVLLALAALLVLSLWKANGTRWPGVATAVLGCYCWAVGALFDRSYYLLAMLALWAYADRWGGRWRR